MTTLYDEAEVKKYWNISLPEELQQDETVRIVAQVKDGAIWTIKEQIRTAQDTINFLDNLKLQNPDKDVGISISTAVFEYNGNPPSADNFRYTNSVAIDIDTHIGKTKERYVLGYLEEEQIALSVIKTWLEINQRFQKTGLNNVLPLACTLTGGGLQFILGFERALDRSETQRLFGLLKEALKNLKWNTMLRDTLGNYLPIDHDIDASFADIVHVQRCAGTINQKYNIMSRFIPVFEKSKLELLQMKDTLAAEILDTSYSDNQKIEYSKDIITYVQKFIDDMSGAYPAIEVQNNLMTAKMKSTRVITRSSDLKNIEYELLQKIKKAGVGSLELLGQDVNIGQVSGNLTKLYCPFHEETNPSMAFYENEIFDVFRDFHDDTSYNLISFWEKLYEVSKSTAITQIAEKAGVPLAKSERKDFQNLEMDEIIDVLIDRVDEEKFIYYRSASKNKNCVVRTIDTGESFIFDGPKMLANHVLQNQLKITDVEKALVDEFAVRFQEKVLIDAFEEFFPSKPAVYYKEFICFVNLWVPNKNYRQVHELIEEQTKDLTGNILFSNGETIKLIKKQTPWMYKFLLQIIQNGDMSWFINWLAASANFNTIPVLPVVYGCPGAGKNLFVTHVMEYYFGREYTKVVSGDRVGNQFNSVLETASILVLDESDFASSREFDSLKFMTGNESIMIEKKGVDVVARRRHFNVMLFSNGSVPLRHASTDRRITYYNNEFTMLASVAVWKTSIDEFLENIHEELTKFWAIICRTEVDRKQMMKNVKDGGFRRQILKMHPAGDLIMKLMDEQWDDIALQLNENVTEDTEMKINLELLAKIQSQFQNNGNISLALINRYLQSLNFRMKTSIQRYVADNHLNEFGIDIVVTDNDVLLKVDKRKVKRKIKIDNLLKKAYPSVAREEVSELDAEIQADVANITYDEEEAIMIDIELPPAPEL